MYCRGYLESYYFIKMFAKSAYEQMLFFHIIHSRVIRITEINLASLQDDKFRIHISEIKTSELLGKQDIPVQLLAKSSETNMVHLIICLLYL